MHMTSQAREVSSVESEDCNFGLLAHAASRLHCTALWLCFANKKESAKAERPSTN